MPGMPTADQPEKRAQKSADALRAMLTALATAGIAAAYVVGESHRGDLWRGTVFVFGIALACVVTSWFMVKHRELQRPDFEVAGAPHSPHHAGNWVIGSLKDSN